MNNGNSYTEKFFEFFQVIAGGVRLFRTQLFGQNGADLYAVETDNTGKLNVNSVVSNFPASYPVTGTVTSPDDTYTLAYIGSKLNTITRTFDGKTKTFTWTGDNLTGISLWV